MARTAPEIIAMMEAAGLRNEDPQPAARSPQPAAPGPRFRWRWRLRGPKISAGEFDRLVSAYQAEASDDVRERLADSVARSAGGRLEKVIPLIEDCSLGGSRVLLVRAVTRSEKPEARTVLKRRKDDRKRPIRDSRRPRAPKLRHLRRLARSSPTSTIMSG